MTPEREESALTQGVCREVRRGLRDRCAGVDLVAYAEQAIGELAGSVVPEALPEMAARLVAVRVTRSPRPFRVRRAGDPGSQPEADPLLVSGA